MRRIMPLLVIWLALVCSISSAGEKRPNVLLIITDDQGYGDLSCHGNPHLKTPHLDKLAGESIRFDRFFVNALCAPTRASLLTGRYSLRTGVSGVMSGMETLRAEEVTLAEILRDSGYRTGLFGKWHNGEHYPHTPNGQGFSEFFGYNLGHWNNYFDTTVKHNGDWVKTSGFIVDATTDRALDFIEKAGAAPFFAYVSYATPHSPFQCPDNYFNKYKQQGLSDYLACVYGMCENLDDNVARLLKQLDERKLRDDTIVIFMTDNGPNGQRFNGGMRGTKGGMHEGGNRVPFFLRWPARFKEPKLIPQIAAHIDVLPTLAELCGVALPQTKPLDGRSLVPLLEGRAADWPERTLIFQHGLPGPKGNAAAAVRTQRYRLVTEAGGWHLFDMQADPAQEKNIAASAPQIVQQLAQHHAEWWKALQPELQLTRLPLPVGHAEEKTVELPAPQARFDGGLKFSGKHPNNAWLVNWTDMSATVEWDLNVVAAGDYAASLLYSCEQNDAGARVRIAAGDAATEVEIKAAPAKQVPSPDRVPRDEVYEMEWATFSAGTLKLPVGAVKLRIQALSKPGAEVLRLKALRLTRQ